MIKKKQIYNLALEENFFAVITSSNEIKKTVKEGKPSISWEKEKGTMISWVYSEKNASNQRDNDFDVIKSYK